jgi:hypothetical protein
VDDDAGEEDDDAGEEDDDAGEEDQGSVGGGSAMHLS